MIADYGGQAFEIVAVIEDLPDNTHFHFDMLLYLREYPYDGLEYFTYLKFRPDADLSLAVDKCNMLNKRLLENNFNDNTIARFSSITESLTSIHTDTSAMFDLTLKTNRSNLFFIVLIVLFVMGIVISNFISLHIIQGEKRATEISIHKTNGADRQGVMKMLFGETFLVTFLSFLLAVGLFYGCFDVLTRFLNFNLPANVGVTWQMWGMFVGLFISVAFIAGGYPAYYLSKFSPTELIRKSEVRKYRLTAASVIVQFSVVIFCVSALFVIWRQLDYMRHLSLGFQPDHVMETRLNIGNSEYEGLKSELLQFPEILEVSVSQGNPLNGGGGEGIFRHDQEAREAISVEDRHIEPGYFDTYRIPLLEGRDFSGNRSVEKRNVILSESTVAALGLKDPVGKKVYIFGDEPWTIIGVAKNVLSSAHFGAGKWIYTAHEENYNVLSVRFVSGKYPEAKASLMNVLKKRYKDIPMTTVLTTDLVRDLYVQDEVTFRILAGGTVLAIALALLGLLALSGFVVREKRKEISLRRVMGAEVREIVYSLNRYIIIRIAPAVPVGIGLSCYAMSRWLENFEYSIALSWWIFALAVAITFIIILFAVFYQSLKAALANPIGALKSE